MRVKHSSLILLLVLSFALLPSVARAQTTSQTDLEGITWGDYKVQQSMEFGVRFSDDWQKGNPRLYNNYVNLHQGPRLLENTLSMRSLSQEAPLFDNLFVNTFGFGGDPNNLARVKISKNKWYNFSGSFRRDQNFFDYPLFGNPLNPATSLPDKTTAFVIPSGTATNPGAEAYYTIPQFQDSSHGFQVRRRMYDFDLTILPQAVVTFRAGYSRINMTGPSFTSFHEGTDFMLGGGYDNTNTTGNTYRFGADFKFLPKTTISYDQTLDYYKNDTNYDLSSALGRNLVFTTYAPAGYTAQAVNFGLPYYGAVNNPCANFIVSTSGLANPQCSGLYPINPVSGLPGYYKYQRTRTDTLSEQISFASRAIKNVDLTGRYIYSSADMTSPFSEDFYGAVTRTQERRWGQQGTATAKAINNSAEISATIHLTDKLRVLETFRFFAWRTPMFLTTNEWAYVPAKLNGRNASTTNCRPGDVPAAGFTCAFLLEPVVGLGVTPQQALTAAQSTFGVHNSSTGADQGTVTTGGFLGQNAKWNTISVEYDFFKSFGARVGYRYGTRRDAEKEGYEVGTEYYYPNPVGLGVAPTSSSPRDWRGTFAAMRGNCANPANGGVVPADVTQSFAANGVCTATIDAALSEAELFDVAEHTGLFGLWYRPKHNLRINGEVEFSSFDAAVTRVSPRHQQHYRFRSTWAPSSKAVVSFTYNGIESTNPGIVIPGLPSTVTLNSGATRNLNPGAQPNGTDINYKFHNRNFGVSTSFAPTSKVSLDIAYNYNNYQQTNLVCPVYASTSDNTKTGATTVWPNQPVCPLFLDQVQAATVATSTVTATNTLYSAFNSANGTFDSTNHFVSFYLTLRPTKKFTTQFGYNLSSNDGNMLVLSPWLGVGTPVRNPTATSTTINNNANVLALPNTYGAPSSLASNYHMPSILVSYEFIKNWTAKAQWSYYGYGENTVATGSGLSNNFHANQGLVSLRYAF